MSHRMSRLPDLPKSIWRHLHDPAQKNFTVYLLPRPDKPNALRITPYPIDSPYLNNIEAAYINTHCAGTYEAGPNPATAEQIYDDIEYLRHTLKGEIVKEGE